MAAACLNACPSILTFALFLLVAPLTGGAQTQSGYRTGRISGASHVNLRSGPGVSHPSVTILKNGDPVNVQALEGTWYRVSLPGWEDTGYIYEEFLEIINGKSTTAAPPAPDPSPIEVSSQTTVHEPAPGLTELSTARPPSAPTGSVPEVKPAESGENPAPGQLNTEPSPAPSTPTTSTPATVPGPGRTLQNRLWWITRWFVVPLCIFALGWICGGNYYLRRDRIERTKIRF